MSRLESIAVAFSILAAFSGAGAQSPPPSASPPVAAVTPAQKGTESPIRANRDAATTADARRCLEFPINLEVIKCAEKYLQRRRNG